MLISKVQKMRSKENIVKMGFGYYCKGLTSKEISVLLGVSFRTVQNYMHDGGWKEKRAIIRQKNEQKIIRKYLKSIENE